MILTAAGAAVLAGPAHAQSSCKNSTGLGVARTVEIDASAGGLFGSVTNLKHEPSFLRRKEVVLTFDDGPMPWITKSILGTLDAFCTKATFFSVGRMALAYPATVREIVARGHTLGTHTFSHPLNMRRLKPDKARAEIERGIAAVSTAAGVPVAPFFRFPGLSDSTALLGYLRDRKIATLTVDTVSNDSFIAEPDGIVRRTLAEVEAFGGGIVLFHDIKTATAKALPRILEQLKARGYTIVHLTAAAPAAPLPELMEEFAPRVAAAKGATAPGKGLLPFYGAIGPQKENMIVGLEVAPVKGSARPAPETPAAWTPVVVEVKPRKSELVQKAASRKPENHTIAKIEEPADFASGPPVIQERDIPDTLAGNAGSGGWAARVDTERRKGAANQKR